MFMVHRILLSQAALAVAALPQTVAALAVVAQAGCRQVQ
jgi:hypothetical protein